MRVFRRHSTGSRRTAGSKQEKCRHPPYPDGMNRLWLLLLLFLVPLAAQGGTPEIVFQTPSAGPIEQPLAAGPGSRTIEMPLPIARVRGARLDFRALIKADDVATPPQVYNGVKFMLVTEGPSGKQYPARDHLWGTFDWTPEHFRAVVPADATKATLVLGLEATTGRAWFRDVSVTVNARAFGVALSHLPATSTRGTRTSRACAGR